MTVALLFALDFQLSFYGTKKQMIVTQFYSIRMLIAKTFVQNPQTSP